MTTALAHPPITLGGRSQQPALLPLPLEEPGQPGLARAIVVGALCFFTAFLLWASVTRVPEVAIAQGAVTTIEPVAPVQHLEGGIIEAVLVADGATVRQGQPLLRFSSEAALAELDQLRAREAGLRFQAARLRAYLDGTDFVAEEGAFARLAADQKAELENRLRAMADRAAMLGAQLAQRQADQGALAAQLAGLHRQLDLQAGELTLREKLLDQGLTTRVAVLEVRRAVLAATAEIERLEAVAAAGERAVAEATARLAETDSSARAEAARDYSRANQDLAEVSEAVRRAMERAGRLTVLAPAAGTVKGLVAKSPGQVVQPGAVLMEIVPRDAPLLVEARLSPRDVGFARIGQPVTVKVQAFDYSRYGTLDGTLLHISATTTPDEHGQPWYLGRVQLAADHVGHDAAQNRLLPGMTVQADITTGGKTLLQYLLKPVHAAMSDSFRER